MKIVESESTPICPYCHKQLEFLEKITHGFFQTHVVYVCPHCKAVLSVGTSH